MWIIKKKIKKNISKWEETLKYLISIMNENGIKYYLSASGLEYVEGSKIYPYDIDIFVSKESVQKLFNILKEYVSSDLHYWQEGKERYLEFQGISNNIPFEICEWSKNPKE